MRSTGINNSLIQALEKENIISPTQVQSMVIPKAMSNLDIVAQSMTGTGKTIAYLLPIFEKHDYKQDTMQAIILTPTHELAIQVVRQIERLSQNSDNHLTVAPIIGNVNIDRQIKKLKEKPNILVGSPGRILELIKKKKIKAHTVKTIVIDEADRLLDKNNVDTVLAIIKSTQKDRQVMCFSATITDNVIDVANKIAKNPEVIKCDTKLSVPKGVKHMYFEVEQRKKVDVLRKIINAEKPQKSIIFIDPSPDIELITEKLKFHKIDAESLHGNNIKFDRKATLNNFESGKLKFLIASDIASRGLNISDVTHIINFNLKKDLQSYVHRVGRTARNGKSGIVMSLVTPKELEILKKHARKLDIDLIACDIYKGEITEKKGKMRNEKSASYHNNGIRKQNSNRTVQRRSTKHSK